MGDAMTREKALEVLELGSSIVDARARRGDGLTEEDGDAAKVIRAKYRALCLRWHPDKNPDDVEKAKMMFTEITCAYHTLTTANFDHERWARTYEIPPLQRLEDVLALALSGMDPFEIEAMLRARGEYRPHVNFGVDVRVPWEAGERPEADFNCGASAYSKTRALGDGSGANETRQMELAWAAKAVAGASDERPWERVGGVGFDASVVAPKKSLAWKASDAVASLSTAEELNDQGMALYAKKKYADALALYVEAARMEPGKIAYQGNTAAAALLYANELRDASPQKAEVLEIAISACESAIAIDESYVRGYVRGGKALLALGDATQNVGKLKRAREMLHKALELDAANSSAKAALKDVEISLQLFDSDSD